MENIESTGEGEKTGADAINDQKVESIILSKDFQSVFKHKLINIWIYNYFILAININI